MLFKIDQALRHVHCDTHFATHITPAHRVYTTKTKDTNMVIINNL